MKCPICNNRTRVVNSRFLKDIHIRRRKHECLECLTEFNTNEILDIDSVPPYLKERYGIEETKEITVPTKNTWSDKELKALKHGLDNNMDYEEIVNLIPGRTIDALYHKATEKNWSKKDPEYLKYLQIAKERGISRRLYYDRVKYKHWDYERAATEPNNRQKVIS